MSVVSSIGTWVGNVVKAGLRQIGIGGEKAVTGEIRMEADRLMLSAIRQPNVMRMPDGKVVINVATPGRGNAMLLEPAVLGPDGIWRAAPRAPRPVVARPAPKPAPPVHLPPPAPLPVVDAAMMRQLGLDGACDFGALTRAEMRAHIQAGKPVFFDLGGQRFLGRVVPAGEGKFGVQIPTDDVRRVMYQGRELIVDGRASTVQIVKTFTLDAITRDPAKLANRVISR